MIPLSSCKSEKKNILCYLFIWMIIDHSFMHPIGCLQQPMKYVVLSILVICKDINTFLTLIVPNYSFAQLSSCPVCGSCQTKVPGFVSFFWFRPLKKKIFPLYKYILSYVVFCCLKEILKEACPPKYCEIYGLYILNLLINK